ncbi:MAG: ATP-binding protein [Planctomycetota bacterium]
MSLMEKIETKVKAQPRRLMVYGPQGVGKSTFALGAEAPIVIQTEDGLGSLEGARFPLARSFGDVIAALGELYTQKHIFKTVVIDSVDWLERLIWAEVCREKGVSSIEEIGFSKGYKFSLKYWQQIIDGLSALRSDRTMTVVIIAHSKIERFEDPEGEAYDKYSPRLHSLACALLVEWCDEVLFANHRVFTKQSDDGFGRKRTVALGSGERVLRTGERPAHLAKNRLGLPEELPLEWGALARFFKSSEQPTTKKAKE